MFNAANEIAVAAFLSEEVTFPMVAEVVEETLDRAAVRPVTGLDDVLDADREARELARSKVESSLLPGRFKG